MWIQKVGSHGVRMLAYAPDGRTLYVMDCSGWVTAWDVSTRSPRRLFQLTGIDQTNTTAMATTADGGHLIIWTNELQVWDIRGEAVLVKLPPDFNWRDAQLHPDGRQLITLSDRGFVTWDIAMREHGRLLGKFRISAWLEAFGVSPDGTLFVAYQPNPTSEIYLVAGKTRREFPELYSWLKGMRFTADGRTLILYGRGTDQLLLWDVPSFAKRGEARCWLFRGGPVIHPTAPVLAGCTRDGVLTLLDLETSQPLRSLDFAIGQRATCVAFSPDGLTCAVGGSNKQFAVFDVDV